MENNCT